MSGRQMDGSDMLGNIGMGAGVAILVGALAYGVLRVVGASYVVAVIVMVVALGATIAIEINWLVRRAKKERESATMEDGRCRGTTRAVIIRGQINTGKLCPPGHDYCWVCGHVALAEEYDKGDKCPNPDCPAPKHWDD